MSLRLGWTKWHFFWIHLNLKFRGLDNNKRSCRYPVCETTFCIQTYKEKSELQLLSKLTSLTAVDSITTENVQWFRIQCNTERWNHKTSKYDQWTNTLTLRLWGNIFTCLKVFVAALHFLIFSNYYFKCELNQLELCYYSTISEWQNKNISVWVNSYSLWHTAWYLFVLH